MKSTTARAWADAILAAAKSASPALAPGTYPDAPPHGGPSARVELLADVMARGEYIPRLTLRALVAAWGPHGVTEAMLIGDARKASKLVREGHGPRQAVVVDTLSKLDACYRAAMEQGLIRDAIAALRAKTQITGPLVPMAPRYRRDAAPAGLPPELARLAPPPSPEEIDHFATTAGPGSCTLDGCRVHPRAQAAGEPGLH